MGYSGVNERSASTTFVMRAVKIACPPKASRGSTPKASRWHLLPWRDPRKPLSITIKLRGGEDLWVEIHARGSEGRYPGYACIWDILQDICQSERVGWWHSERK